MYSETRIIKSTNVNINKQLLSSSLFSLAQEVAMIHATELGMGTENTINKGILWVIARQCAQIYKMPKYEDIVTIETWPGKPMHMFYPRYTRFRDSNGETMIELAAFWTLIDEKTRTTINLEDTGMTLSPEIENGEFPRPKAIKKLPTEFSKEFVVSYSNTDMNGHFTNAKYLDIAEDLIPDVAASSTPKCIKVEYSNEIKFGETFTINYTNADNVYYFSGDGDKHKFTIQLEY